ncbi:voltage-dependent P/Q-type calcium channel subunit alpha-1A [Centropristis striata]|uniref:voltage-dependent P/Q-type calcium channel subunit alpha-1A n=1 Tax=Centropristis striata TaxID=184440 RepID=UPI0027E025EA|nr:voltage-dependent P/Q-type calcium channel subunit alpha-1A [Centropristis striata]
MLSEMMCRRSCSQQEQQEQQEQERREGGEGGEGGEGLQREAASRRKHGWSKSCRGRRAGGGGWPRGRNSHHHHHPQAPRPGVSLRPVNVKGNRARGMRAPKNTNQFLMHEKYQLLHLRSDSVGSDSGSSSDSDLELTDMDSYLGVLENARGALLDSPSPPHHHHHHHHHHGGSTPPGPPGPVLLLHQDALQLQEDGLRLQDSLRLQEDSMQYFPSEDDLIQSQNFMQRDFVEFCGILTP